MERSATRIARQLGAVLLLLIGVLLFAGSAQAHSVRPGEQHPVADKSLSASHATMQLADGQRIQSLRTADALATRIAPCCAAGAPTGACCTSAGCMTPLAALTQNSTISPNWIWQQVASDVLPHSIHDGVSAVPSVPPPRFVLIPS